MSTFRKSLKLKRSKSLVHEVRSKELNPKTHINTTSSTPTSSSTLNRRSISILRHSFRSLSSQLSPPQPQTDNSQQKPVVKPILIKKARKHEIGLFKAGSKVNDSKLSFKEDMNIKICKTVGKSFKTFKKWNNKKNSGRVLIGSGRIIFQKTSPLNPDLTQITFNNSNEKGNLETLNELESGNDGKQVDEEYIFEMNKISSLYLASVRSKELLITFKGDDQIFFIKAAKPHDVQKLVKFIFIETRRVCYVLNKVFESYLPGADLSQLRSGESKLTKDEIYQAELCLRELVDLTLFCRGPHEISFVDIAQFFGSFLVELGEDFKEEAQYWISFSHQAKLFVEQKLRQKGEAELIEIDTKSRRRSVGVKKRSVLQELRNPSDQKEIMHMKGISTPDEEEVKEMMKQIKQGIYYSAKALQKKQL